MASTCTRSPIAMQPKWTASWHRPAQQAAIGTLQNAGRHGFPWEDDAHLGDLPALLVTEDGSASQPVLAPRLKRLEDLHNRSLMIHAGGDNHADHPQPLGGGGARVACGVIKVPTSTTPI